MGCLKPGSCAGISLYKLIKHGDELAKAGEKGILLFLKNNTNFTLSLVIKPIPGRATPSLAAGSVSECSHLLAGRK